jgi:hypothetical protein
MWYTPVHVILKFRGNETLKLHLVVLLAIMCLQGRGRPAPEMRQKRAAGAAAARLERMSVTYSA